MQSGQIGMTSDQYSITLLSPSHVKEGFSCGYDALDNYLIRYATQDIKRHITKVYVAHEHKQFQIAGYYAISAYSYERQALPVKQAKRLPPYHHIPAAILGRLAVDTRHQGHGLGEVLLLDAFERIMRAHRTLAVHAVIADAKDERAKAFYQHYGFTAFPETPLQLFLPVKTIEMLLDEMVSVDSPNTICEPA